LQQSSGRYRMRSPSGRLNHACAKYILLQTGISLTEVKVFGVEVKVSLTKERTDLNQSVFPLTEVKVYSVEVKVSLTKERTDLNQSVFPLTEVKVSLTQVKVSLTEVKIFSVK